MRHKSLGQFLTIALVLGLSSCSKQAVTPDGAASSSGAADNSAANTGGNSTSAEAPTRAGETKSSGGIATLFSPKPIIVDAGTEIAVTADQTVSSKSGNPGDRIEMSVAEPVVVGEKQVIPRGAKATGSITVAKSAGKFKGNAELSVTLTSIVVKGKEYDVETNSITKVSKGRGKRTAIGAGGGAGVGALIGAIAGGGKGAAIGAAAGAGAGTAGAAYTGERDITIPAETQLHFRLKEAVEIKGK